jgi:amino acid permease
VRAYVLKTTSDRVKLIVEFIEIAVKVIRFLPIIVFSYAGLTLVFAVINLVEHNTVTGIVLCVFAGFGIYLAIKISQKKIRWNRKSQTDRNT